MWGIAERIQCKVLIKEINSELLMDETIQRHQNVHIVDNKITTNWQSGISLKPEKCIWSVFWAKTAGLGLNHNSNLSHNIGQKSWSVICYSNRSILIHLEACKKW